MKSVKKLAGSALVLSTILAGPALAADEQTITTVVKVTGENWFIRMNEGVDAFNADKEAIDATQIGPAQADAAQQARIIEDLVAKGVSAIAVVPMDPSALEGVLRRAQGRACRVLCVRARVSRVHAHVSVHVHVTWCVRACMHCVHSQANKRDYDELPDNLREGITAHFAERYEEVYEIAFAEDD